MAASAFERVALARTQGYRPDGPHPDVLGSIDQVRSWCAVSSQEFPATCDGRV